jgi:hypothetical protein
MEYERTIILIALVIVLISSVKLASAAAVGVSPATLSFSIPRGGEEIKTIEISTNSETPLKFSVSMDKSLNGTIEFEVIDNETVKGKSAKISVKAHSLRSAIPGKIDGALTAVVNTNVDEPSGSGSRIAVAVAARINVEITNEVVPLIKNKLAFATISLLGVLVVLGGIYLFKIAGFKLTGNVGKSLKPKKARKKRKGKKSRK